MPHPSATSPRIVMIGGGYVGLVSGSCLAAFGAEVTIVEQNPERLAQLEAGIIPIFEPGLAELVDAQCKAGRLHFGRNLETCLKDRDAAFIAVGTPARRGSGHADLSYVFQVAEDLARFAHQDLLVVTKSTVPVGTGRKVAQILAQNRPDLAFIVASNPEFLREGNAIADFMYPDRIIVGLDTNSENAEKARSFLTDLYCTRNTGITPNQLAFMGLESAELAKYAANAFLAMKVSFINEMADLCEASGGVVEDVARGMGLDPRIGPDFLRPGPGYGGSCFPKDTRALATTARQMGTPMQLVETTIATNEARKRRLAERILSLAGPNLPQLRLAVLGLAFKANTDDMRDAPALTLLPLLLEAGACLHIFDPQAMPQARKLLPAGIHYAPTAEETLKDADILVVLTEWKAFQLLSPDLLLRLMRGRTIVDYRNIWSASSLQKAGFSYYCLGQASPTSD